MIEDPTGTMDTLDIKFTHLVRIPFDSAGIRILERLNMAGSIDLINFAILQVYTVLFADTPAWHKIGASPHGTPDLANNYL